MGGVAACINTGALSLIADINKETVPRQFTGQSIGDARAWMIGAEAAMAALTRCCALWRACWFVQQKKRFLFATPPAATGLLKSTVDVRTIATSFLQKLRFRLYRDVLFSAVWAHWSFDTKAKTTYFSAPHFDIITAAYPSPTTQNATAFSLSSHYPDTLHEQTGEHKNLYHAFRGRRGRPLFQEP